MTNLFNITPVDIDARIAEVRAAPHQNDFDFHVSLASVFQDLYDAHTKYSLPAGYGAFTLALGVVPVYNPATSSYIL